MSKLGAAFLTGVLLAAIPCIAKAAEAPHRIARDAAWGCRDKHQVFNLLFLGLSTSFDDRLAQSLADGSCVFFKSGETVTIIEDTGSHGLVKVKREGAEPATFWTQLRNVD
ncbi:MAG TPA: hypothetical protein VG651_21305 [Stellaceae bacterium]|nr:hypothetical protein [Stellaceae bacterium]